MRNAPVKPRSGRVVFHRQAHDAKNKIEAQGLYSHRLPSPTTMFSYKGCRAIDVKGPGMK